jgi:hypothetical protein
VILKLDYDRVSIHSVGLAHDRLRRVIQHHGWKVKVLEVWKSRSKKGIHVVLDLKTNVPNTPWNIIMFEQVFRSDPNRGLWQMSRLLSKNVKDWEDQDNWDLLWEDHIEDKEGLKLLRRVWR